MGSVLYVKFFYDNDERRIRQGPGHFHKNLLTEPHKHHYSMKATLWIKDKCLQQQVAVKVQFFAYTNECDMPQN